MEYLWNCYGIVMVPIYELNWMQLTRSFVNCVENIYGIFMKFVMVPIYELNWTLLTRSFINCVENIYGIFMELLWYQFMN